ncbi:hypothetical protein SAMN05444280_11469 [Tangfeifania diversioriginum]|uniref:Uncharacterized protein n=1 Tax=Tangfeifania diversioriginum TaxID=1168035 RepID=A0A1M6HSM9_9BACT|nr:hypothetical protein SAMN05444280_11469 [Tangfeifania diversioriginum]
MRFLVKNESLFYHNIVALRLLYSYLNASTGLVRDALKE